MMRASIFIALIATLSLPTPGCSDDAEASAPSRGDGVSGVVVETPFEVSGEAAELLLMWFDHRGVHQAPRRSDIPWARRRRVRVDSLELAPTERLDPAYVYVADMRESGEGGAYPVRRVARGQFDAWVEAASGRGGDRAPGSGPQQNSGSDPSPGDQAPAASPSGSGAVVIYGTSWCGACRAAAAFLRRRGVEFSQKDIERDAAAREAMESGMRRAGLRGNGVPVIDVRGHWVQGFDERELDRLLRQSGAGR